MILKCSYSDSGVEFRHVDNFWRYHDGAGTFGNGRDSDPFWVKDVSVEVFPDNCVSLGVFDVRALINDEPLPPLRMAPRPGVR